MPNTTSSDATVVEAATLEEALAEVAATCGPDAEILDAQKVHRGGVGGFFAKELVQITARETNGDESDTGDGGVAGAIASMVDAADAAETGFHELLQSELTDDLAPQPVGPLAQLPIIEDTAEDATVTAATDTVAPWAPVSLMSDADDAAGNVEATAGWIVAGEPARESEAAPQPAVDAKPLLRNTVPEDATWRTSSPTAPVGYGAIDWSATALARIGLPPEIVDPTKQLDPRDDLAWIEAVAAAVAPLCRDLPEEDTIVVGAHADRLADPMGLPLVNPPDMPPYSGSVCAVVTDDQRDLDWLQFVKGDRKLHLVVGDEPWRELLIDDPVVVSWSGDRGVVDAIYLASTLDGVLGFGTVDGFASGMVRARPVDIALAIRRLVGRK